MTFKWMLVILAWNGITHPLPEEEWGRFALNEHRLNVVLSYDECLTLSQKVLATTNRKDLVTVYCVPWGKK